MTQRAPHVIFMGLRGSGKSTLGHLLARELGCEFVDLDDRTPRVLGATTVAEAWSRFGEPAFRDAEAKALQDVLEGDGRVVALGGGTPTAPGAADRILAARARGDRIIYLRADPHELRARLEDGGAGPDRPSLTGASALDEIPAVFAARDPLYVMLAEKTIECGAMSPRGVLAEVLEYLRSPLGGRRDH